MGALVVNHMLQLLLYKRTPNIKAINNVNTDTAFRLAFRAFLYMGEFTYNIKDW